MQDFFKLRVTFCDSENNGFVTLGGAGQGILIYLMNDVSVSGANIASCPLISFFSSSTTRHTLTLTTGNLLFTGSSYVAMSTNYPTLMHFDGVDLKLGPLPATIGGFPVFGVYFPIDGAFNTLNCTFTRDPAAGAVLFATSSRTEFDLLGCTFVGSWPGNIFYGIAAGVNPNSTWSYSSNLTSA